MASPALLPLLLNGLPYPEVTCEVEEGHLFVTTLPSFFFFLDSNTAGPVSYKNAMAPIPRDSLFCLRMISLLRGLENMVGVKGF